ncbi:DUF2336 domain-containing protein [Ancylobacter radicis]|uniref:DUF2336 domain-containing protein n=1 Tax=Ancylobacter radicis TaxID=2836179 RepID=A0ABS5R828_9HYPH|nr:DUF2336 domain-containing protein [Ancylobacter radicis]MBS9477821.1 DUF2336 domain-containing protein [Ancylobacter radicis]
MIVRQFLLWARTAPDEARAKATSALARAYLRSDLGAADRSQIEAALPALARDPAPEVRLALAAALADHPLVPADLVLGIAAQGGAPGAVMLARSPVPSLRELIHFCETDDEMLRVAIAARRDLAAEIAAVLARKAGPQACLALVGNRSADLTEGTLACLVARYGHVPAMREALLARPNLPASTHQALIREVAGTLSAFVAERRWMSADEAARVAREACESEGVDPVHEPVADTRADPVAELRAAVETMRAKGKLTPVLALRAILSGEVGLFREMVSVLADLPSGQVAAMLADRSGRSFRTVYDRIGLPRGAYVAFRTALEVVQAEETGEMSDDTAALKRRILDEVIARYESQPGAERLLAMLRGWRDEAGGRGIAA